MKLTFRVDSSYQIGSGHVMRCLTLAEHLRLSGWEIEFICRALRGNLIDLLKERDFRVGCLPAPTGEPGETANSKASYAEWLGVPWTDDVRDTVSALEALGRPDWLLVDHYALDRSWEAAVAPHAGALFVIDDLANRSHSCSVLLDHNLNSAGETRYLNLVPAGCRLLCGPAYALLRPEFERAAAGLKERDGTVRRLLIFFGGVDATGETLKACEAVLSLNDRPLIADVVVGVANPRHEQIRQMCEQQAQLRFHGQVCNMAELMASADLALGAGGTTTWERAYLGLPAMVVPVAENQMPATLAMAAAGAVWNLGFADGVTSDTIARSLRSVMADPDDVRRKSRISRQLVDGDGVRRVAAVLAEAASGKGRA